MKNEPITETPPELRTATAVNVAWAELVSLRDDVRAQAIRTLVILHNRACASGEKLRVVSEEPPGTRPWWKGAEK